MAVQPGLCLKPQRPVFSQQGSGGSDGPEKPNEAWLYSDSKRRTTLNGEIPTKEDKLNRPHP